MTDGRRDVLIVGGGIVGLATALECVRRFPIRSVLVLEKETLPGTHQSSHNSGVIHSGLYYRPGTLKARACVQGAAAMMDFCRQHDVPLQVCGKVVVATSPDELPVLEDLYRRGIANGVPDLARIGSERLRELEVHCAGLAALHVPGVAITDYGAVARKLADLLSARGGELRVNAKVIGIRHHPTEISVETEQGTFLTRFVINCAGLYSDRLCRLARARPNAQIVPFRGEYYELVPERRLLVRGLIYPVPDPTFPFLGVHFTPRINGGVEVGPNAVLALCREGYRKTDFSLPDTAEILGFPGFWRMAGKYWRNGLQELYRSFNKRAFVRDAQRLLPELRESDLQPGGSGVRAQALDRDGRLLDDFSIVGDNKMIHVLNVPSPAATASLAIARHIVSLLPD